MAEEGVNEELLDDCLELTLLVVVEVDEAGVQLELELLPLEVEAVLISVPLEVEAVLTSVELLGMLLSEELVINEVVNVLGKEVVGGGVLTVELEVVTLLQNEELSLAKLVDEVAVELLDVLILVEEVKVVEVRLVDVKGIEVLLVTLEVEVPVMGVVLFQLT